MAGGDTVQQVKERLSIVDVVSSYIKLDRAGTIMRARCPFHAEKTPSFIVSPDRGTFHCFGCNQGGDIFTFVQQIEGTDFKGALKILADRAGVPLVYSGRGREEKDERDRLFELMEAAALFYTSRFSDAARTYLNDRGITDATIRSFRLGLAGDGWTDCADHLKSKGFSEKEMIDAGICKKGDRSTLDKFRNRIMFPIADTAGRVIAFSGRIFGEHASPDAPKYLNSPETILFHKSSVLYGFDKAKQPMRKLNCAILVEGQVDLLASHQSGWENAVAASGTAFTAEHAALIHRMTDNLVIALDGDQAGIKAAARAARAALSASLNVKVAQMPDGLDPADLVLKEGPEAWKAAIRDAKDIVDFLLDVLEKHARDAMAFRRTVEMVVLPFLVDVRSPIAREQYARTIAARLHVSETAVLEAVNALPKDPDAVHAAAPAQPVPPQPRTMPRDKQCYALIMWQQSLTKPAFDIIDATRRFEEAVSAEAVSALRALPSEELDILTLWAAKEYAHSTSLANDLDVLLKALAPKISRSHREALEKEE